MKLVIKDKFIISLDTGFTDKFKCGFARDLAKISEVNFSVENSILILSPEISFMVLESVTDHSFAEIQNRTPKWAIMMYKNLSLFHVGCFDNIIEFTYMINRTFTKSGIYVEKYYSYPDGFGKDRVECLKEVFNGCPITIGSYPTKENLSKIIVNSISAPQKYIKPNMFNSSFVFNRFILTEANAASIDFHSNVNILAIYPEKLHSVIFLNAKVIILLSSADITRSPDDKGFICGNNYFNDCVVIKGIKDSSERRIYEAHFPLNLYYYYSDIWIPYLNSKFATFVKDYPQGIESRIILY